MVRYRGPRVRIIRRLGLLPGLTKKSSKNRTKTPGQHGKIVFAKTSSRSSLSDHYRERLFEKQKLRFFRLSGVAILNTGTFVCVAEVSLVLPANKS